MLELFKLVAVTISQYRLWLIWGGFNISKAQSQSGPHHLVPHHCGASPPRTVPPWAVTRMAFSHARQPANTTVRSIAERGNNVTRARAV